MLEYLNNLIASKPRQLFHMQFDSDRESDMSQAILPDEHYFELRLLEAYLAAERQYWVKYMPMTVVVSTFKYNGEDRVVPVFVNNDILGDVQNVVGSNCVEYRNVRLAGPIPYVGDDVSVFVGLFAIKSQNIVQELIGVIQSITSAFDPGNLSEYLAIAGPLEQSFRRLIGLDDVNFKFGFYQAFEGSTDSEKVKAFKDCNLAYINCARDGIDGHNLKIEDERLVYRNAGNGADSISDFDRCLVSIRRKNARGDYSSLAFHRHWLEARKKVWQKDEAGADASFLSLAREVAVSPDLSEKHRIELLHVYKANLEAEKSLFIDIAGNGNQIAHRGGATADNTQFGSEAAATSSLRDQAKRLHDLEADKGMHTGFLQIADHWNEIDGLGDRQKDFELTDSMLEAQRSVISTNVARSSQFSARDLAQAMITSAWGR